MKNGKIRLNQDAYGWEIWDCWKNKKCFEIIENDVGYIDVSSGPSCYFAEYKDWPKHQKLGLNYVKGRVLDIGCGAGRVELYLQKRGFDVIGIDNSPLAVKICKLRGVKKVRLMSINDISKFKDKSFDTIVMMGNNFGLLGGFRKSKRLLRVMHSITSDNGLIIAESNNPYKTKEKELLSYHAFNRKRGRMGGQARIRVRYKKHVGPWFDYLLASEREMEKICENTGWKINKIIQSGKSSYIAIIGKAIK